MISELIVYNMFCLYLIIYYYNLISLIIIIINCLFHVFNIIKLSFNQLSIFLAIFRSDLLSTTVTTSFTTLLEI